MYVYFPKFLNLMPDQTFPNPSMHNITTMVWLHSTKLPFFTFKQSFSRLQQGLCPWEGCVVDANTSCVSLFEFLIKLKNPDLEKSKN